MNEKVYCRIKFPTATQRSVNIVIIKNGVITIPGLCKRETKKQ